MSKRAQHKAREFYENVCMRAVNQCVGRAIRHIKDYSAIILIDERYGQPHIQEKLSQWVRKRIVSPKGQINGSLTDEQLIAHIKSFFSRHKVNTPK